MKYRYILKKTLNFLVILCVRCLCDLYHVGGPPAPPPPHSRQPGPAGPPAGRAGPGSPGARCQVPGARCQVICVRCQVPGARCQVPGVRCQVSGARWVSGVSGGLEVHLLAIGHLEGFHPAHQLLPLPRPPGAVSVNSGTKH